VHEPTNEQWTIEFGQVELAIFAQHVSLSVVVSSKKEPMSTVTLMIYYQIRWKIVVIYSEILFCLPKTAGMQTRPRQHCFVDPSIARTSTTTILFKQFVGQIGQSIYYTRLQQLFQRVDIRRHIVSNKRSVLEHCHRSDASNLILFLISSVHERDEDRSIYCSIASPD